MELIAETRIAGSFKGWNGGNVYKLINGQYWKQARYKYNYHYAYRPDAKVWRDGSRYYLEVDGMSDKIEVKKASASDFRESEE